MMRLRKLRCLLPATAVICLTLLRADRAGGAAGYVSAPAQTREALIRYGLELVRHTNTLIGPQAGSQSMRYGGNGLDCASCHRAAGTLPGGLPLTDAVVHYPVYRARSGLVVTLADRIEECMTRSMNGRMLPPDSQEMAGFLAYISSLGASPPRPAPAEKLPELNRAADPGHGKEVFSRVCAACHGAEGAGRTVSRPGALTMTLAPPLWGAQSFNDGAGLNRLIAAARFIHANMPPGARPDRPVLNVDESWDVAGYVLSQPRPHKAGLDADFPKRLEKPADVAYGPYIDGFSPAQHRFGPFAPIRARLRQLQQQAASR